MFSIRWRLTIFNAISLLVISILMLIAVIAVLGVRVQDIVEDSTRDRVNQAARILATTGDLSGLDEDALGDDDVALVAFDDAGAIIYRFGRENSILESYPGDVAFESLRNASGTDLDLGYNSQSNQNDPQLNATIDESYVFAVPLPPNNLGVTVIAGSRSYDAVGGGVFGSWVVWGGIALVALLVATILASNLITKAALKPINALAASADTMSESDLSQRLPVGDNKRNELDQLARTFNGLLGRLQSAFRDREVALDEQRRFVQDASHELRTPLTSILGYTRMLWTWGLDNPETSREAVAAIEREADRMHGLVERLLTLAHGDADAFLNLRTVDLRDVVTAAVNSVRSASGDTATISCPLPETSIHILIEPDLITQALVILLDNAVKFSSAGSPINVRLAQTTEGITIAVKDSGMGIAEREIAHVFDRFYRSETSRTQPGSGLGLAIARQIAERHGGQISVQSTLGHGSTFSLMLPLSQHPIPHDPSATTQT